MKKKKPKSVPAEVVFSELNDPAQRSALMLRAVRTKAGLTQRELAILIGTKAHGQLADMEKCRRPISKGMAYRLAAALKCSPKVFM